MSTKNAQLAMLMGGTVAALCTIAAARSLYTQNRDQQQTDIDKVKVEHKQQSIQGSERINDEVSMLKDASRSMVKGLLKDDPKKYSLSLVPGMIIGGVVTWISSDSFWYKVQSEKEGEIYMVCLKESNNYSQPRALMDHEALCHALVDFYVSKQIDIKPTALGLTDVKVKLLSDPRSETNDDNEADEEETAPPRSSIMSGESLVDRELEQRQILTSYLQLSFCVEGTYFTWSDMQGLTTLDQSLHESKEILVPGGEKFKKTSETGEAVHIEFHNQSSESFYVYWLNHEGRPHNCGILKPAQQLSETKNQTVEKDESQNRDKATDSLPHSSKSIMKHNTFVGHAWLICNKEIDDVGVSNDEYQKEQVLWKGCMVTPVFGGKVFVDDAFIKKAVEQTANQSSSKSRQKKTSKQGEENILIETSTLEDEELDGEEEDVSDDDWLLSPNEIWGARVDGKGNLRVKYFNKLSQSKSDTQGELRTTLDMNMLVEAIESKDVVSATPPQHNHQVESSSFNPLDDSLMSAASMFQDSFFAYEKIIGFAEVEVIQERDGSKQEVVIAYFSEKGLKWSPDSSTLVAIKVEPARDISQLTLVESWPSKKTGLPRYSTRPYLRPGDEVSKPRIVLYKCPTRDEMMKDRSFFMETSMDDNDLLNRSGSLSSSTVLSPTRTLSAPVTPDNKNSNQNNTSAFSMDDCLSESVENNYVESYASATMQEEGNVNDQYNIELDTDEEEEIIHLNPSPSSGDVANNRNDKSNSINDANEDGVSHNQSQRSRNEDESIGTPRSMQEEERLDDLEFDDYAGLIEWTCIEVEGILLANIFPNSAYWLHQDNFDGEELELDWGPDTPVSSNQVTRWLFVHYLSRCRKVRRVVAIDIHDGSEQIVFEDSVNSTATETTTPFPINNSAEKPTVQRHFIDGTCDKFWRAWLPPTSSENTRFSTENDYYDNASSNSARPLKCPSYSLLYLSEKSGYNHLYLAYWVENEDDNEDDKEDKRGYWFSQQLTHGEFVVFDVLRVLNNNASHNDNKQGREEEEEGGRGGLSVLFKAGGVIEGQDPYYRHLCRLDFFTDLNTALKPTSCDMKNSGKDDDDGGGGSGFLPLSLSGSDDTMTTQASLKVLTGHVLGVEGVEKTVVDANHHVILSENATVFIDIASRVDLAPISCVRCAVTGTVLTFLHQADMQPLVDQGWVCPERVESIGADGKTAIYGILLKPTHLSSTASEYAQRLTGSASDSSSNFPVLLNSYAGPHDAYCPKEFSLLNFLQGFVKQGFVVAMCDGHGTNRRGVEFHQTCYRDISGSGLPDIIKWLQYSAETRPWMRLDGKGVGIMGGSAGGQTAVKALLDHGNFFKVAVADCGCHDNRVDKLWWNEAFLGLPPISYDEPSSLTKNLSGYDASSNVVNAGKLPDDAKLMLVVGERDENVDPSCTMQLAGALQQHNKDFELVVAVGYGHGAADHCEFARRKRLQFLIQNLM